MLGGGLRSIGCCGYLGTCTVLAHSPPPPVCETTIVKGKSVLSLTTDEASVLVLLKAGANPDEQVGWG